MSFVDPISGCAFEGEHRNPPAVTGVEEDRRSDKRGTGSKSKLTRDGSVVIEIIPSNDDVTDHPHDASV